jgi:phosphoglycerate kinase
MIDLDRIRNLQQLDVAGRRVFVRADLDGPRSPQGAVQDDTPLRMLLPTLRYLVSQKAKVVVASSLTTTGREASRLATQGLAERFTELLGAPVAPLSWTFEREVRNIAEGQVAIAPDLSAFPEEAAHDERWAAKIASSIDVYVTDGLRGARDGGASAVELPRAMPSRGIGSTIEPALQMFHDAIGAPAPERYALLLGGPSVRRVAPLARAVLGTCNDLLLGGAVGNTFLVAQGWKPGGSHYEADAVDLARELLELAGTHGVTVHSPLDAIVRSQRGGSYAYEERVLDRPLQAHEAAVDVGLETCNAYRNVLAASATVLWVGLMGDCSVPETQRGSLQIGQAAGEAARAMAAGEDTVAGVRSFRLDSRFQIAAGGDAVISLLANESFPGLEAIQR